MKNINAADYFTTQPSQSPKIFPFKQGQEQNAAIKDKLSERVKDLILEFYREDSNIQTISLEDHIYTQSGILYSSIETWFIEMNGITIKQYAMEVRVNKIKELLVYSNLLPDSIAGQLGYPSVEIMSAELEQQTGLPISFFLKVKQRKEKMACPII